MKNKRIVILMLLIQLCINNSLWAQKKEQIWVGPNVMINTQRPNDGTNYELHIAAHPTDPMKLIASGILTRTKSFEVPQEPRCYVSNDGGYSWQTNTFPQFTVERYGDPVVAYGRDGSAYFVVIGMYEGKGKVLFYSSKDGRFINNPPKVLSWIDHEMIHVDLNPKSYYYGSIYMAGLYRPHGIEDKINNQYDAHIGLLKSNDEGETWDLVDVASNHEYIPTADGVNSSQQPIVFTNGELLVPFHSWSGLSQHYWLSRSKNGGKSFEPPIEVATKEGKRFTGIVPSYAVDISESKFRNRVYMTWKEGFSTVPYKGEKIDYDKQRILVAYSDDRGKTWSEPQLIASKNKSHTIQFMPTIAVNKNGDVGVVWYESKIRKDKEVVVEVKFSASLDGGNTFLPEVKVTTQSTYINQLKSNITGTHGLWLINGEDSYRDYFGLATTSDGVFHPIWLDGRTGVHQLYTARITVSDNKESRPNKLVLEDIKEKVEIVSGAPREFSADGYIEMPIQIKNKTVGPIYGTIRVNIFEIEYDSQEKKDVRKVSQTSNLFIDENNKRVSELTLDVSKALGNYDYLPPNAISEEILIKFKKSDVGKELPRFGFEVTGMISKTNK